MLLELQTQRCSRNVSLLKKFSQRIFPFRSFCGILSMRLKYDTVNTTNTLKINKKILELEQCIGFCHSKQ